MHYLKELEEKIHFMVLEVTRQLDNTLKIIKSPKSDLADRVKSRDDHIDNYKAVIENICFSRIHGHTTLQKKQVDFIRALNIIANNLERISDFAVNIVRQLGYLGDVKVMQDYRYKPFFRQILAALENVVPALFGRDLSLALKICRAEFIIDKLYKDCFDIIIEELNQEKDKHDLITCIFIFRYLERMGDSLLNIGEAVIFSVFGEKLKIHQYQALKESLDAFDNEIPLDAVGFESIWESRSGCRIGKIIDPTQRGGKGVLFKEGKLAKISSEKKNIEKWAEVFPSLVPRIISYNEARDNASMLLEFLQGCSFQETLSINDLEVQENALFLLKETLAMVWEKTMRPEPAKARFMDQVTARVDDVLMVHPGFDFSQVRPEGAAKISMNAVIELLTELENAINAPFSVFIHGDFNTNNIIYHQKDQQVYFIDLHRSCYNDYVQDVSVFLASNFRLSNFDQDFRDNIHRMNRDFFQFARQFARNNHDDIFMARLAFGLVRSFFTSTRFELDPGFSRNMYQRAVFLAQKLLTSQGQPWRDFDFSPDIFSSITLDTSAQ